jgi:hypothetical protein
VAAAPAASSATTRALLVSNSGLSELNVAFGVHRRGDLIGHQLVRLRHESVSLSYLLARSRLPELQAPDPDAVAMWAGAQGKPTDIASACRDPDLIAAVPAAVHKLDRRLNHWENTQRFVILDRDFTVEDGEPTPAPTPQPPCGRVGASSSLCVSPPATPLPEPDAGECHVTGRGRSWSRGRSRSSGQPGTSVLLRRVLRRRGRPAAP